MVAFPDTATEMPRAVKLTEIGERTLELDIEARPAEREALARRFGIVEIKALTATVSLRRMPHGDVIRLDGALKAQVTQTCVVSLQPVEKTVAESFTQLYSLSGEGLDSQSAGFDEDDGIFSPPEEETPEPVTGGAIDVGEAVAEQFGLALDPYPRAPGAEADVPEAIVAEAEDEPQERTHRPFAVLKDLKTRN